MVPASGMVPYEVAVTGREGVDCEDVTVRVLVDHSGHTHEAGRATGCRGDIKATLPAGHDVNDVRQWVLEAVYSADPGGAGTVSLIRGEAQRTLQPARKQAEHYDTDPAVRTETAGDTLGGGLNVGFIRNGSTLAYSNVNLNRISAIRFRLACNSIGGTVEVRKNSPTGALLGSATVTSTGNWQRYAWYEAPLTGVTDETIKLYLVFKATGTHFIANANFFEFVGDGIVTNRPPVVDTVGFSDASPKTADTLRALVTTSDADGHQVGLAYRWLRNGEPIAGASGPELDLSVAGHGDKGDRLSVEVTPSDPYGAAAPKTSAEATVGNSAPRITAATADAGVVGEGSPVAFDGAATDADGDPVTFAWEFGDGTAAAGPAATHRYADGPGEHTAILTVTDGDGATDRLTTAVRVENVAPVLTAARRPARAGRQGDRRRARLVRRPRRRQPVGGDRGLGRRLGRGAARRPLVAGLARRGAAHLHVAPQPNADRDGNRHRRRPGDDGAHIRGPGRRRHGAARGPRRVDRRRLGRARRDEAAAGRAAGTGVRRPARVPDAGRRAVAAQGAGRAGGAVDRGRDPDLRPRGVQVMVGRWAIRGGIRSVVRRGSRWIRWSRSSGWVSWGRGGSVCMTLT